ncbi:hypothetical protein BU17DRAFT_68694 [Hysterangium stoloniferum]|nr:hypothetical protein BU17DRAFT_68694 [Hysterangium stoloniferum]
MQMIKFLPLFPLAITAGVLIPGLLGEGLGGGMGRNRRCDFGEKPKPWEVWVDENGQIQCAQRAEPVCHRAHCLPHHLSIKRALIMSSPTRRLGRLLENGSRKKRIRGSPCG